MLLFRNRPLRTINLLAKRLRPVRRCRTGNPVASQPALPGRANRRFRWMIRRPLMDPRPRLAAGPAAGAQLRLSPG